MPDARSIRRVVCLGAGGHARVVLDALAAAGGHAVAGVLDADPARAGALVDGHRVLGDESVLAELAERGVSGFVIGFDGVGRSAARARAFERAVAAGLDPVTVMHPSAIVAASATLGRGVAVLARAVVNPGARIADGVILNTGCIVEHDCRVEVHAHVAPGAVLLGNVRVGAGAHVGAGAVVREGLSVGADAVVGAGAVVIRPVEPRQTVVGVPAASRSVANVH